METPAQKSISRREFFQLGGAVLGGAAATKMLEWVGQGPKPTPTENRLPPDQEKILKYHEEARQLSQTFADRWQNRDQNNEPTPADVIRQNMQDFLHFCLRNSNHGLDVSENGLPRDLIPTICRAGKTDETALDVLTGLATESREGEIEGWKNVGVILRKDDQSEFPDIIIFHLGGNSELSIEISGKKGSDGKVIKKLDPCWNLNSTYLS